MCVRECVCACVFARSYKERKNVRERDFARESVSEFVGASMRTHSKQILQEKVYHTPDPPATAGLSPISTHTPAASLPSPSPPSFHPLSPCSGRPSLCPGLHSPVRSLTASKPRSRRARNTRRSPFRARLPPQTAKRQGVHFLRRNPGSTETTREDTAIRIRKQCKGSGSALLHNRLYRQREGLSSGLLYMLMSVSG